MADSTRSSSSRKRRVGVVDPPDIIISPKRTRSDEPDSPRSSLSRTAGASGASGSARARARGGGEWRTHVDHSAWGVEDVVLHLVDGGIARKVAKSFREHRIRGKHLLQISREDLERMGVSAVGDQKDVLSLLGKLSKSLGHGHVFNDPIHGHVELHPLLMRIIDTPQFQRLRYIKQLGGGYYVFPGASHNRFEHSIGVCHLAGELVETLQRKQPELSISPQDVLCVKIAGLCHDLGHGPFSHLFDSQFIKRVRPDTRWKHEDGSVRMFEHLLESNDLKPELLNWGLDETDLTLIKEQIAGPLESQLCSQKTSDWPYCGRTNAKSFLYEIVANKRNGVDVDKWDYFARDCHCLGIPNNFDTMRYMKFARVIDVNNRKQICTRDKEVGNLYEMFHTRSTLHRRAYQHKTSKIIEIMITEALEKANEHFFLLGSNGKEVRLSESIDDMVAYTRLTDQVFQQILLSTDPNLKESREILEKIERRQLYKCVGQTQPSTPSKKLSKDSIAKLVISSLSPEDLKADELPELTVEDIVVDVVSFDYGMGDQNPIDHVRFYTKDKPNVAVKVRKDQVSQMLPQKFKEENVRVYCKSLDKKSLESAWKYFITWCRQQDCITPKCAGGGEADQSSDLSFGEEREEETHFTTPYGTPYGSTHKADNGGRHKEPICGEVVKKLFPH